MTCLLLPHLIIVWKLKPLLRRQESGFSKDVSGDNDWNRQIGQKLQFPIISGVIYHCLAFTDSIENCILLKAMEQSNNFLVIGHLSFDLKSNLCILFNASINNCRKICIYITGDNFWNNKYKIRNKNSQRFGKFISSMWTHLFVWMFGPFWNLFTLHFCGICICICVWVFFCLIK